MSARPCWSASRSAPVPQRRPDPVNVSTQVRAEVVYAGYGVHAPDQGYSDYDGIDVRGKIVAFMTWINMAGEAARHFPEIRGAAHVSPQAAEKLFVNSPLSGEFLRDAFRDALVGLSVAADRPAKRSNLVRLTGLQRVDSLDTTPAERIDLWIQCT